MSGSGKPPVWYFPTEDPEWVIACDLNPATSNYDLNCRRENIGAVHYSIRTSLRAIRRNIIKTNT